MRQRFPRQRITLNPIPGASPRDWFFQLRPGPIADAFNYWHLAQSLGRHALVASLLILVPIVFPLNQWTLLFFYIPVLGALIAPFLAEVTYASRTAIGVVYAILLLSCLRIAFLVPEQPYVTEQGYTYDPSDHFQGRVGWMFLALILLPLLFNSVCSFSANQSVRFASLFGFLMAISAASAIPTAIPWLPNRFYWCLVALSVPYGRTLVSTYSCRLAASPSVSFEASIALSEPSRRKSKIRSPMRVSRLGVTSAAIQAATVGLYLLFLGMPGRAGNGAPCCTAAEGIFALCAIAMSMLQLALVYVQIPKPRVPFIYLLDLSLRTFFQALALWETDAHPTPYAPGSYTAARLDVGGIPFRSGMTWALLVLAFFTFAIGAFGPDFALPALRRLRSLYDLPFAVVLTLLYVEGALLITLFLAFSPAMVHVRLVADGVMEPEVTK